MTGYMERHFRGCWVSCPRAGAIVLWANMVLKCPFYRVIVIEVSFELRLAKISNQYRNWWTWKVKRMMPKCKITSWSDQYSFSAYEPEFDESRYSEVAIDTVSNEDIHKQIHQIFEREFLSWILVSSQWMHESSLSRAKFKRHLNIVTADYDTLKTKYSFANIGWKFDFFSVRFHDSLLWESFSHVFFFIIQGMQNKIIKICSDGKSERFFHY